MKIKTRSEVKGAHVHTTLFMTSGEGDTYQNCGELIMSQEQHASFVEYLEEGVWGGTLFDQYDHEGY